MSWKSDTKINVYSMNCVGRGWCRESRWEREKSDSERCLDWVKPKAHPACYRLQQTVSKWIHHIIHLQLETRQVEKSISCRTKYVNHFFPFFRKQSKTRTERINTERKKEEEIISKDRQCMQIKGLLNWFYPNDLYQNVSHSLRFFLTLFLFHFLSLKPNYETTLMIIYAQIIIRSNNR